VFGQVAIPLLRERHEALVEEMLARGFRHESPLPEFDMPSGYMGFVDMKDNYFELWRRCAACRSRMQRSPLPAFC
jgi:hypothetical protein